MNSKISNIESLVSQFNKPDMDTQGRREDVSPGMTRPDSQNIPHSDSQTLWSEFLDTLSLPKDELSSSKPYKIDDDIIETIQQCDFKTSSTQVVNSILRVFLMANLDRLRSLRIQPTQSLFDKYPQHEDN